MGPVGQIENTIPQISRRQVTLQSTMGRLEALDEQIKSLLSRMNSADALRDEVASMQAALSKRNRRSRN